MNTYEQKLVEALASPIIILAGNPRSDRMRYVNAINNTRNKMLEYAFVIEKSVSILCRQKHNRIIIGPKDFDAYLPIMFDLGTCSQEELTKEFKATYPLPLLNIAELQEFEKKTESEAREKFAARVALPESSGDVFEQLGFGKKTKDVKE